MVSSQFLRHRLTNYHAKNFGDILTGDHIIYTPTHKMREVGEDITILHIVELMELIRCRLFAMPPKEEKEGEGGIVTQTTTPAHPHDSANR